ncbi:peptidase U32 family protein [Acetanaerobacterium sp. MSJ-12]|uniref:peptidase U32 family protein n=1 Tax=Acetanaerobacterium sp. MSJ-12 TaxID=2841535 RepID=UPI00336BBF2C
MLKKPELLAPAGDEERLEAALLYGADAVYLGGQRFGMRAGPENFSPDGLRRAVALAHQKGVKVYLTCNTLPRQGELAALPAFLAEAAEAGVDAFIVADLGVMEAARQAAPQVALHVSTQLGVVNAATATALYKMGASRVVLARELSLEEIASIRRETPPQLELEAFVHGAMCMSVSGRCLLSQYLAGRDPNRGDCAQPCRWRYRLEEESAPGVYHEIGEIPGQGSYLLNAGDLRMIEHIGALAAAGVGSFKIEGRAKSVYYAAAVTNAYRIAIDRWAAAPDEPCPDWLVGETEAVSHRPYTTGFYFGQPRQFTESGQYLQSCQVAAVAERWADGRLWCRMKNRLREGEELELLLPGRAPLALPVADLRDGAGEPIREAIHPHMAFSLRCEEPAPRGAILRRRLEGALHR